MFELNVLIVLLLTCCGAVLESRMLVIVCAVALPPNFSLMFEIALVGDPKKFFDPSLYLEVPFCNRGLTVDVSRVEKGAPVVSGILPESTPF